MKIDIQNKKDYDIEILDGPYIGKYNGIKHYICMEAFGEIWLNEYDGSLEVHKSYNYNTMKLLHSSFFLTKKNNMSYFDREYTNSFRFTNNLDIPPITTIDSKPVHLDRVWCYGDYSYEINEYSPEEFLKRTKYLSVRNGDDVEKIFRQIGEEFGIELLADLSNISTAKETKDPYRIKLYAKDNRSVSEYIIDESDTAKFLICNQLLEDEKYTVVFRKDFSKQKAIMDHQYRYTINTGIKNPLLYHKLTEYNEAPLLFRYNEKQMVTSYDGNDTSVEANLNNGIKGSFHFYPATWRFNRDHIFGTNLYYFDSITNDGANKHYMAKLPCNEVFRRILYRRINE